MKTPADKTITLTLYSHPMKDLKMRWKALVVFAAGSTDETPAEITMCDGEGTPIEKGTFEFAGRKLKIVAGETSIRYADFIQGKHEVELWVRRPGLPPVPGGLTFQ